ncbi:hypothetical protein ACN47E_000589 [Coniothyrium glycines]
MVIQRAGTKYRRIEDESDLGDGIALLARHSEPTTDHDHIQRPDNHFVDHQDEQVYELRSHRDSSSGATFDDVLSSTRSIPRRLPRPSKRRFFTGWRVGVAVSLAGAMSVFLANLIVTVWVSKRPGYEIVSSIGTLYQGSCARSRRLNVMFHLVINTLSTLLLAASNYCMQVLSAPNREELIQAHASQYWLHIGVPSFRNLRRIGRDRAYLWGILCISSVPLHLLFNSVVFTDLQANNYIVVPTTEEWLYGEAYDTSGFVDIPANQTLNITKELDTYRINFTEAILQDEGSARAKYQNLSTNACFNKYNGQYLSDAGNVFIVQEQPTVWRNLTVWAPKFNGTGPSQGSFTWTTEQFTDRIPQRSDTNITFPFLSTPDFYPSNGWRCPSRVTKRCNVDNIYEVPRDRSEWKPYDRAVRYCMVEQVEEMCRLQFSFPIAIVVIISNFVKAVCMAVMLVKYKDHKALVTIGDAIAHFLDEPDPETRNRCLYGRRLMEAQWTWELTNRARKDELGVEPEEYAPEVARWGMAPSGARWIATYSMFLLALFAGLVCLGRSLSGMPKDIKSLWAVGFSNVAGNNLLGVSTTIMGGILLANAPQALLTYLYLAFNALYTNMFVAREWSSYSTQRKTLRVTMPTGQQRDTYWLNVPFRFAIPLTVLSGLFHWLTSQSIFAVRITVLDAHNRNVVANQISTCGYSPIAIILTTILGSLIAIGGVIMARFKYPVGMPLAGSCSAAISAACHPSFDDLDASLLPLQWGAVTHDKNERSETEGVGHCCFTSLPVELPILGRRYA